MLQDWEPGHFFMYGNAMFSHWRAGEIVTFDWPNMPHCTANASLAPRALLVVTGQMSAATRAFIREGRAERLIPLEARELACSS
jgi:hypothetical protein